MNLSGEVAKMISISHYQEFLKSAIAQEIIELNFKSLSGDSAYEHLLYGLPDTERRNDGRLRDKWLKRYEHLNDGGWWCGTIDPLTGQESDWGCFKPDKPRIDHEKGKPLKYEHPPKVPSNAFFLKVTWENGLKIATKCSFEDSYKERMAEAIGIATIETFLKTEDTETFLKTEDTGFWQWVKTNLVPIIITEGAKKTACLLSAGYCAIGLSGIYGGYRQERDYYQDAIGLPYLIPQLIPFATPEREISFCFDNDPKPKTKQAVKQATLKTGNLFRFKGSQVSVVTWNSTEKGVDDLIAATNQAYFDSVYESRISLSDFKIGEVLDLSPYVDLYIHERYLPDGLVPPDAAQLIGIKSVQGTGKTEWLARLIEPLLGQGKKVIAIVHREQLAVALAHRFGIDYRTEIRKSETKGIFGYTLCIDSLHPKANPKFNPSEWEGATVILDEVEQVLWHLLAGATCQNQRVSILKTFKELLNVVVSTRGKFYLADADLSPISIKYIESLIDQKVERWIVQNTFKPKKKKLYVYDEESDLLGAACKAVEQGRKILFLTDGQKHKSTWGTRVLEQYFNRRFSDLRILRIDSESVSDPKHPAMGCMENLNSLIQNYDVVLASPTIETGISIDSNHFDDVYCISHGVQTVDGVSQFLERVRSDIPRHIWVAGFSPNQVGNGSNDIRSLLAGEHKKSKFNLQQLTQAGYNERACFEDDLATQPSLLAWAKRGAIINAQVGRFKESLLNKLSDRYDFLSPEVTGDGEVRKDEIKETKAKVYGAYCNNVSKQQNPTNPEYKALKEKRAKTEDERLIERKGKLCRRYATEDIQADLVRLDDDGWYEKIKLHYYLTVGRHLVTERDNKRLQSLTENDPEIFKPDLNKACLSGRISALSLIDVKQFFNRETEFSSESLQGFFEKINNPQTRSQFKLIFGFSFGEKESPIAVVQRLLGMMGLKLEFVRQERRDDGKRVRIYRGCGINPDGRQPIFERWYRLEQLAQNVAA